MSAQMKGFTMDVISACAFGIKVDSINDPKHPMVINAKKILTFNFGLRTLIVLLFPKLKNLMNVQLLDKKGIEYFDELTHEILAERKKIQSKF